MTSIDLSPFTSPPLTIGAVSRAVGIPVSTLRTWERRYGFPDPIRSDGNQRLYDPNVVDILRLVQRALDRGLRPRQVLSAPREQLRELAGLGEPAGTASSAALGSSPTDLAPAWLRLTRALDGAGLESSFRQAVGQSGIERFLLDGVVPFLSLLGDEWRAGRLAVYQEHFATERLRDFLGGLWRPLSASARGPRLVLTTLPGEHHTLGLHVAATAASLAGARVLFLGEDTPVSDIAAAAGQAGARAVALSVSASAVAEQTRASLLALRDSLPDNVDLLTGGAGGGAVGADVQGVTNLPGLVELARWIQNSA